MYREDGILKIHKIRDLSVIDIGNERYIVIAVDSFGGIGPKEHDVVKLSVREWAVALLRVPLMEVIATGASPILVIDALGVEYDPTGKEVIEALREELSRLGYIDLPMNGSTEDNIPVSSSSAGIVVLGAVEKDKFFPGSTKMGDNIFVVGIPKSGPDEEVDLENDPEIPDISELIFLRRQRGVHDILPVGSHGIAYEAGLMGESAGLKPLLFSELPVDVKKSAGPSTCFILSSSLSIEELKKMVNSPVYLIGRFEE